jgi:hypothetical protein
MKTRALTLALLAGLTASTAHAGGSLGIPTITGGYPTNVGLLIIGHSTSHSGGYPSKLVEALNDPGNVADGRHYFAMPAYTFSDGGFLWSRVSVAPTDPQYERVRASRGATATQVGQWCEDAGGTRWSCRRAKVDAILKGNAVLPTTGTCGQTNVQNGCGPLTPPSPGKPPSTLISCTWYDRSRPLSENPVTQDLTLNACWLKMDYHLALIQDTTNRSWKVDDFTGDGLVNGQDLWPSSQMPAEALPCKGTSGVVNGSVDWNCDGLANSSDAAHVNYASWLARLSRELLDSTRYGAGAVEHVFLTQKPLELGDCGLYPSGERTLCTSATGRHAVRSSQQIAATPGRPFDHYYLPTVYWEHRAIEQIFANVNLDSRIHRATPNARDMWNRSVKAYDVGLTASDWTIPASVPGRPGDVPADDTEVDSGTFANSGTVGSLLSDHVHHTDNGGWMMADVWYGGLRPYLQ